MGFLMFIILLAIMVLIIEKVINKLFGVEKIKISETAGKNVDQWRKGILIVVFLFTYPFFISKDPHVIKLYWILYFIVLNGSQLILEWKYLKSSKQYVTTLIYLIIGVLIIYNIEYFTPLFGWS